MSQSSALVVDDSSTSRMILTKILRKMDIHCEQASSGEDALSHLSWFRPNFIFLDHLMPGMDGFQTLKRLKQNPATRDIPVVMYTSQHAHKYYEEAHKLGAAGVISKQIDRDKLYLMINNLCMNKVETKAEEDVVPTVYQEVQKKVEQAVDDASISKLVARISTLETAYEELNEENRSIKLELAEVKADQAQHNKRKSISVSQILMTLFLAFALFGSTFTWFTTQRIEQSYINTQKQIQVMSKLIDDVIDLFEEANK